MIVEDLIDEVLALPKETQLKLVDEILKKVHELDDDVERAWLEESQRRYDAYKRGEIKAIPAEEVFEEMERILA